jgi:hypothetical protein
MRSNTLITAVQDAVTGLHINLTLNTVYVLVGIGVIVAIVKAKPETRALLAGILAAFIVGSLGAYVLWQYKTTAGLAVGVTCVFLAVGIALPLQLKRGAQAVKDNAQVIIPVVVDVVHDALPGGERHTDPPAAGPKPGGGGV